MADLGRVVVLAGGLSYEREVSLRSGSRVCDALQDVGVEAVLWDADAALLSRLIDEPPAAVFVALHGASGEDGTVRDLLDLAGVPYVGATGGACRLAFDKPIAKSLVGAGGGATPESVALRHAAFRDFGATTVLARIVERLGLPLMVKPSRGGSALGASVVRSAEELPAAMVTCFSYGEVALVERYVTGVEVAVSVVEVDEGRIALPPVQIRPVAGPYDYTARYTPGMTEFSVPAELDLQVAQAVAEAALSAHRSLGLRDLSRTDLIVADDVPHFLEVNVAPGMTETSLLPMSVAAAGRDLGSLCRELLQRAAER